MCLFRCVSDDQSLFSLVKALTPEENPVRTVFVYILVSKVIYVQKCQRGVNYDINVHCFNLRPCVWFILNYYTSLIMQIKYTNMNTI